jgi:hypothetical protein
MACGPWTGPSFCPPAVAGGLFPGRHPLPDCGGKAPLAVAPGAWQG